MRKTASSDIRLNTVPVSPDFEALSHVSIRRLMASSSCSIFLSLDEAYYLLLIQVKSAYSCHLFVSIVCKSSAHKHKSQGSASLETRVRSGDQVDAESERQQFVGP